MTLVQTRGPGVQERFQEGEGHHRRHRAETYWSAPPWKNPSASPSRCWEQDLSAQPPQSQSETAQRAPSWNLKTCLPVSSWSKWCHVDAMQATFWPRYHDGTTARRTSEWTANTPMSWRSVCLCSSCWGLSVLFLRSNLQACSSAHSINWIRLLGRGPKSRMNF